MPARAEVVEYLKGNLKKFPADALRAQLAKEGVTDAEFDAALREALKPPPAEPTKVRARASGILARVLMFAGLGAIVAAAALAIFQKPAAGPGGDTAAASAAATTTQAGSGESGFVGHSGYVIKLPPGYAAVQRFKDERKTVEVVHFCKADTDPTNFLDEGLFGQLGIVRLRVEPSPIPDDLHGLENLTALVQQRAAARGEKFALKNLQISTMRGVQLTYEAPFPRVESFLLGRNMLYSFTAGEDDDIYRSLLESLRDSRSEM
jgi:hypothetical protein